MKLEHVPASDRLTEAPPAFLAAPSLRPMRILLLQGPVGGFFRYLQRHLTKEGHSVRRLVFNGGDIAYAIGQPFEIVRKSGDALRDHLDDLMATWRPDHVILFGDERPIHRIARDAAKARGVPVWCFEEGYIRPNYVTFELGGNNANSPLRGVLGRLDAELLPARTEPPPPPPLAPTRRMAANAIVYYLAYRATRFLFPRYQHHRDRKLHDEARYWLRAGYRRLMHRGRDLALCARLMRASGPRFFMVALQVHDDLQLKVHGRGWRMRPFLQMVLESFRAHAPLGSHLVVKAHPLDIGYGHQRTTLDRQIEGAGLNDRVHYLKSGPVNALIRRSAGVVTVNSTMGLAALLEGTAALAFGDTFYAAQSLATAAAGQDDLDAFWQAPPAVDALAAATLRSMITARALIPGSFYLPVTWAVMAEQVLLKCRTAPAANEHGILFAP